MSKFREAIEALYVEAGKGYVSVLDDVRQRVVEDGWFGQRLTPSLDAGIHDLPSELSSRALDAPSPADDLYGPRPEAAEARNWLDVPEEERSAILDLYRSHAARGTEAALEMETALDADFTDWWQGPQTVRDERETAQAVDAEMTAASIAEMEP